MSQLEIRIVSYSQDFQAIKDIRTKVFQEEQGVSAELEFDGLDGGATQLLAYLDARPVGTTRIRCIAAKTIKIERLAILPDARKQGIGTKLMLAALKLAKDSNYKKAVVHAQEYIKGLYERLGFVATGDSFTEAGIPHIKMIKKL
ncbi:GNAT family N-acetyltransferase [Myxosarcina sp. GI1]|uniref:GNAT family N-acetyltransferase n=1 Tax=Myxosarcina sp. GI1 TaxID=1541065 RepID=UPI00055BC9B8|nr:GNAT family N-acetyltransferase [Myxosarcina sp. GI1]